MQWAAAVVLVLLVLTAVVLVLHQLAATAVRV
jgi:hypothetical protein